MVDQGPSCTPVAALLLAGTTVSLQESMPASRTVSRLCQLVTALPSESASRESTQTQSRRPCRAPSGQCPTPIGLGHFSDAEPLPVQIEERLRAGFPCNRVLTVRSCLTAPSLEVRAVVAALAQDSQVEVVVGGSRSRDVPANGTAEILGLWRSPESHDICRGDIVEVEQLLDLVPASRSRPCVRTAWHAPPRPPAPVSVKNNLNPRL